MMNFELRPLVLVAGIMSLIPVHAEIVRSEFGVDNIQVSVSEDDWHPEGFKHGMSVPATYLESVNIEVDGKDTDPAWDVAAEVLVPLDYGAVDEALVKVLYTDEKIYFRVRWADSTEDREHHPWTWDEAQQRYVEGPQIEDSILLSFEAGCHWNPSLLAGYQYDFDGWHWLASRSDPVGQAWDLMGNIADQDHALLKPTPYASRNKENVWNVKFNGDEGPEMSHRSWRELDRNYTFRPVRATSWYRAEVDGTGVTQVAELLPAPQGAPDETAKTALYPRFKPVSLDGDAGEISAKGHWEDGYWTVEFSRILITPASTATDTEFTRLTQFSINVFDRTERIDEASESERLFLEFLPEERRLAKD
jgi:hypothetical protein